MIRCPRKVWERSAAAVLQAGSKANNTMQDATKTQKELIQDLAILRQQVGLLEAADVAHQQANAALELQVRERTAVLHEANRHLTHVITARTQREHQLRQQQAHLARLATKVVLAEEQERRRIAQGLHDQVGQLLAIATGILDTVRAEEATLVD